MMRKIAQIFNKKTVTELAAFCGYSRQGLYDIFINRKSTNGKRLDAVIEKLEMYTESDYQQAVKDAEKVRDERKEFLAKMRKYRQSASEIVGDNS